MVKHSKHKLVMSNRLLYTLITIGILAVIGFGVYAVAGTTPTPGHAITQIQPCSDGEILKSSGSVWTCGADSTGSGSQWVTSGNNISYNSGNVGIGTTSPTYKLHIVEGNISIDKASSPLLNFLRSDGTIITGETIGQINFKGTDSSERFGALISATADSDWGTNANSAGTKLEFWTQDSTTSNSLTSPRMVISGNGNVGIGTSSPATFGGGWGPVVEISGAPALYFNNTMASTGYRLDVDSLGYFRIYDTANNVKRIFISPNGNVAIGEIDPISNPITQKLVVDGGILLKDTGIVSFAGQGCSDADRGTLAFDKNQAGDDALYVCAKSGGSSTWVRVSLNIL